MDLCRADVAGLLIFLKKILLPCFDGVGSVCLSSTSTANGFVLLLGSGDAREGVVALPFVMSLWAVLLTLPKVRALWMVMCCRCCYC